MRIVADTGPLVGLAKINCLSILKSFSAEVYIPPMVYRELLGKIDFEYDNIETALNDFIRVVELEPLAPGVEEYSRDLHEGEKQVIMLASNLAKEVLILIDDLAGRKVAEKLKIPRTGLVGILLLAKEKGIIKEISPLIDELRDKGYWLSDEIVLSVKRMAKED